MRAGRPGPVEGTVGAPILDSVLSSLAEAPWEGRREPIVVAVSGGMDSMCLLHLLRFYSSIGTGRIHVAHFDHRMRPESGQDARWLAGVTRAWELPIHQGEATVPLTTEAEAREARYAFLAEVKASVSAGVVLTGHTADDQAETVLFRAVRGSGPDGLVGIRPAREDGVERPLLRVWRRDIETYAMRVGLPFREDPSNRDTSWTRNRIRNVILPALEEAVPGAKSSLARLAVLSEMQREALEGLSSLALGQCAVRGSAVEESFVLDLAVLSAWPDAVIAQVLREAGRRLGLALGSGAVERTLRLIRQGRDGASVDLAGRHAATRSSGALRLGPTPLPAATEGPGAGPRVVIPAAGETGQARWSAGAGLRRVRWGPCRRASPEGPIVWSEGQGEEARLAPGPPPGEPALKDADAAAVLSAAGLTFPLELRTRKPGDRMEWTGHDRRLKKIMTETGVPSFDRDTTPVLADALGSVLWIPGLTASGHGAETVGPGRGPSSQPAPDWFCVTLSRLEGEAEP